MGTILEMITIAAGGFDRWLLWRWRQRQVWLAHGLYNHDAGMERAWIREANAPGAASSTSSIEMGLRLPSQGFCQTSKCSLCAGLSILSLNSSPVPFNLTMGIVIYHAFGKSRWVTRTEITSVGSVQRTWTVPGPSTRSLLQTPVQTLQAKPLQLLPLPPSCSRTWTQSTRWSFWMQRRRLLHLLIRTEGVTVTPSPQLSAPSTARILDIK